MTQNLRLSVNYHKGKYQAYSDSTPLDIIGYDTEEVTSIAYDYYEAIEEQMEDTENDYGILYYACGYEEKRQAMIEEEYRKLGIYISTRGDKTAVVFSCYNPRENR